MTTTADRATHAWQRLTAAGARRTLARGMVIDLLAATPGHLSIGEIHRTIAASRPEVNVSTVHRTIAFLVELGVVHALQWPGEALYGLNEHPHIHAVCEDCGSHTEIRADTLAAAVAEARRGSDLDLGPDGLALFGRCADCAARHH
ncbi:transcriptional repressor [Dactylosporangium fulvum]|uniref:Transcriptional repressor n=1 Tax=Dactylosporangium fulvum TaxID=53359 RepID=A0ABY5W5I8_9ACTN|nr:transcriptional repressor [Dactylosporangium fulvum]UWP85263.1 transcriptional repressor [Dactylosporangium fulvum]